MNADAELPEQGSKSETAEATGGAGEELPPIVTIDELARFLRMNRKTVYEAISRGEIPGVRRIGHTFRISRDVVLQWLRTYPAASTRRRGGT